MARQMRSDGAVAARLKKRTACPRAQSETKTGEILAATKRSAPYAVKARKKAESGKALTAQSPSASPMYRASPRQIAGGLINLLGRFRFF